MGSWESRAAPPRALPYPRCRKQALCRPLLELLTADQGQRRDDPEAGDDHSRDERAMEAVVHSFSRGVGGSGPACLWAEGWKRVCPGQIAVRLTAPAAVSSLVTGAPRSSGESARRPAARLSARTPRPPARKQHVPLPGDQPVPAPHRGPTALALGAGTSRSARRSRSPLAPAFPPRRTRLGVRARGPAELSTGTPGRSRLPSPGRPSSEPTRRPPRSVPGDTRPRPETQPWSTESPARRAARAVRRLHVRLPPPPRGGLPGSVGRRGSFRWQRGEARSRTADRAPPPAHARLARPRPPRETRGRATGRFAVTARSTSPRTA